MTFDEFWKNRTGPENFRSLPAPESLARLAWDESTSQEREYCAKVCVSNVKGFPETRAWDESALVCARIIRARSNV